MAKRPQNFHKNVTTLLFNFQDWSIVTHTQIQSATMMNMLSVVALLMPRMMIFEHYERGCPDYAPSFLLPTHDFAEIKATFTKMFLCWLVSDWDQPDFGLDIPLTRIYTSIVVRQSGF